MTEDIDSVDPVLIRNAWKWQQAELKALRLRHMQLLDDHDALGEIAKEQLEIISKLKLKNARLTSQLQLTTQRQLKHSQPSH